MRPNIILVCGGRDASHAQVQAVWAFLSGMHKRSPITHLIHGACPSGVDHAADKWATDNGVQPVRCPALWDYHGDRSAGPIRNRAMAALRPDVVVAFPGNRGTASMVREAKAAGIVVVRVETADQPGAVTP